MKFQGSVSRRGGGGVVGDDGDAGRIPAADAGADEREGVVGGDEVLGEGVKWGGVETCRMVVELSEGLRMED